ncbi:MAG: 6-pyruvoyl-tetrahydropterin synthase-related protein [Actinomycetota bacterium]|nr:6-pyruvoyl-tetrahydropterin synthase-related protein [Actinomycetota bacterium]
MPGLTVESHAVHPLVRERPLYWSKRSSLMAQAIAAVVLLATLLVYFRPSLLFSVTTTTGGDTGAHIYAPWFMREHLLPRGLLAGWSPGWFGGFPMFHFYFPLVAGFQALLSYLISYEVAFKIGTVLGVFFLPVSAYLMFRLLRINVAGALIAATFGLMFLFMDSYMIYGGNIASTLAGEYSFTLSLGLCLVFLGLAHRLALDERGRPLLAGGVLALAVLSHLVPVIIVVLTLPALLFLSIRRHGTLVTARRFGVALGLGFALTAFWSVPFLARLGYAANMHWGPIEGISLLFPREIWIFAAGAALAGILAVARRDARLLVVAIPALWGMAIYFFLPPGHVWNGRFLPFWYLNVFLACAYSVGTLVPSAARLLSRRFVEFATLILVSLITLASAGWILYSKNATYVDDWIEDNYEGYESKPDYPLFGQLVDRLSALPPGRVMWEPSPELGRFGTPVALMSLPYWTDQASMEGMYFESSITTPFHFLTASEVATQPSNPIPGLPYHPFDIERGIDHMRLFDVSYFVAYSPEARDAARSAGLTQRASAGQFSIFDVGSPGQVVVPKYEPVVLEDADWVDTNVSWFTTPGALDVPLVRDGPSEWARTSRGASVPKKRIDGAGSSFDATITTDEISFTTDQVGEPHWIKTSYFPNWRVDGAEGPFLASPSLMMVVPTQADVRLHYERTWAEWSGLVLTIIGALVLVIPRARRGVLALAAS